jgi:hypothetical protein
MNLHNNPLSCHIPWTTRSPTDLCSNTLPYQDIACSTRPRAQALTFFVMTPNFSAIPQTSGPNLHNSLFSLSVIYRYLSFSHCILFLHPRMWDMAPFHCLQAHGRLRCCIPLHTPCPHQLLLSLVVYSPLVLLCRCRMWINCSASGTWMPRALNVPTFSSLHVVLLTPHVGSMSAQFHSHISMSSHLDKNDLYIISFPFPFHVLSRWHTASIC